MRHRRGTVKLGRTSQHRDLMLANIVASLIFHRRIKTTLAKAKAARPLADKLVTLGKQATLHSRRMALSKIGQRDAVAKLFSDIAPGFKNRVGGYTRIIKLGPRQSDSAEIAFLEWVEADIPGAPAPVKPTPVAETAPEEATVVESTAKPEELAPAAE